MKNTSNCRAVYRVLVNNTDKLVDQIPDDQASISTYPIKT